MKDILEAIRDRAKKKGVSFMDARFVENESTSISLQDGKADKVSSGKSAGIGVRVISSGAWGFATTNETALKSAEDCLDQAISMADASAEKGRVVEVAKVSPVIDAVKAKFEIDPHSVPFKEKVDKVVMFESEARKVAPEKISNTIAGYGDIWQREVICNTYGTLVENEYVRTHTYIMVVTKEGALRQRASEHDAIVGGFELIRRIEPENFSVKAAKRAVALLSAKRAPSGMFPVLLHPDIVGLFTHEAIGHNAEADGVMAGVSILEGRVGQKVASELVTIVDDATIEGMWGSYKYDSEGVPGRRRVLVENGVLKGFMHSLETAAKFNAEPNGSARAQNFNNRPIVRMSNTNIQPGKQPYAELLKSIDNGVMLTKGLGGYVNPNKGQFTFSAGEGWMIRKGELAEHIRDVNMSGILLETLQKIDGVSKEYDPDTLKGGMCGKGGQGMFVGAGGPYVRVKELMIGGQE